jgi:hypothetical protein
MAGCLYSQRRSSPLHSLTQFVENTYHYYAVRPLEFHTCVYYVVVSITTTGYGDVTPHSDTGQGVVIAMLLWSFIQVGVRGVDLEPVGVVAPHLHARTYTSCRAHKSRITYTRTCMHAHHPPPWPMDEPSEWHASMHSHTPTRPLSPYEWHRTFFGASVYQGHAFFSAGAVPPPPTHPDGH